MLKCTVEDENFSVTIELKDPEDSPSFGELFGLIKQTCLGAGYSEVTVDKYLPGE